MRTARHALASRLIGSLGFVLALSACAGGGGAAVSKEEFVREANAICADNAEAIDALGPEPAIVAPAGVKWFERLVATQRDGVRKLRALRRPVEDKRTIEEMLSKWQKATEQAGPELVAGARTRDFQRFSRAAQDGTALLQEGHAIAGRYGLDDCTSFGLP